MDQQSIQMVDQVKSAKFPVFLQQIYEEKPGFNAWKQICGNQLQESLASFIQKYASHTDISVDQATKIAEAIDRDKNQTISFEEFMAFIDYYQIYYDPNGSRVRQIDIFLQRLLQDEHKLSQSSIMSAKIIYPDGAIYEGDVTGIKEGKGKLTYGKSFFYEGSFVNDQKQGFGVLQKDFCKYEGNWENNMKQGKGKQTWNDGSFYEGEFSQDLFEGKGKLVDSEGTQYEGIFSKGYMSEGKITYKNGDVYEGQTYNTVFRHGLGKLFNSKGELLYEGNYTKNLPSNTYRYTCIEDAKTIETHQNEIKLLEIQLSTFEGHNTKLLANIKTLQQLKIEFTSQEYPHQFKELTIQLLENMHPDSIKGLVELHIIIPNENQIQLSIQDFKDLFNTLNKFSHISFLDLSLNGWGSNNDAVDGTVIEQLVQTLLNFQNLTQLKLDLHQWGYQNKKLKNEQLIQILTTLSKIKQGQLTYLYLDLGKWCVDTYNSYNYIDESTFNCLSQVLKNQQNLESLSLSIRSWCYNDLLPTDSVIENLFQEISKLVHLKQIDLNVRALNYDNQITQKAFDALESSIKKLSQLEQVKINLEVCWNVKLDGIQNAVKELPKLISYDFIL